MCSELPKEEEKSKMLTRSEKPYSYAKQGEVQCSTTTLIKKIIFKLPDSSKVQANHIKMSEQKDKHYCLKRL